MHTARLVDATRSSRALPLSGSGDRDAGPVDARRAVLYLRPFVSSAIAADSRRRGFRDDASDVVAEADALARAVAPVGPLVAMGRPGAALPELGVLRMCVDHEAWQQTVRHWLTHARLVVLRASASGPDFRWELGEAARLVAPDRLVLLIPQEHDEYERFRQCVTGIFPDGLPDYVDTPLHQFRRRGVNGLIHFERDGRARFVRVERPFLLTSGVQERAALARACEPVVTRLGTAPVQPGLRLLRLPTPMAPPVPSPAGLFDR